MQTQFTLGDWLVDPSENTISKPQQTINIEPKAMALLCLLCEAKGKVVSREDIMLHIWNERYVTDYALNNLISSLRKYLNAGSKEESYIKTRPKKGYQIIAKVSVDMASEKSLVNEPGEHGRQPQKELSEHSENNAVAKKLNVRSGIYAFLAVLIAAILLSKNFITNEQDITKEKSIAVMPFDVFDEVNDLGYFADGLADEIIHQLNTLDDFKVISRRSSFSYRDKALDTKQIAEELNVVYILEGSVREEKDAYRTTLQLVDTTDESIVWSRVFSASQDNSFSIQQEISTDIAKSMDADFTAFPKGSVRYRPLSGEAYLHVLRGRKYNQEGNAEALLKARDEFLMATLLEPDYAMAYVNLAVSYLLLEQRKMLDANEAEELFKEAINNAISIDKNIAEAHAANGVYFYNKNQFQLSKDAFERALEINPKLYLALINYANLLRTFYYPEEALVLYQRTREIAPLSGLVHWGIATTSRALGQFDTAVSSGQDCVERNPQSTNCLMGLAYSYRLNMQHKEADRTLTELAAKMQSESYYYKQALAWHYLQTNKLEQANATYGQLVDKYGYDIPLQTMTYTQVGLSQEKSWFERLSNEEAPRTKGLAFLANYAHAAYFTEQCEIAVEFYELMLSQQPNLAKDIDILANGVTYLSNLAYCHLQLNNSDAANERLQELEEILSSLDKNLEQHPAILFVNAQKAILGGDTSSANSYLTELDNKAWGLSWLVTKDPIVRQLVEMR